MYRYQKLVPLLTCVLLGFSLVIAQTDNPVEELLDANIIAATNDILKDSSNFNFKNELGSNTDGTKIEKSFFVSLLMIIVSEIGDRTFLIAAIMAMKHSRLIVFTAAYSSSILMSVISAFLGHVLPNLIPKKYADVCASLLFLYVGARMMYEVYTNTVDDDELEEVEDELKIVEDRKYTKKLDKIEVGGLEADTIHGSKSERAREGLMNLMQLVFSPVFVQTFALTFLGEWGDHSQISTVALAAANNVYYVISGVVVGHGICCLIAVMGGRMLATKISPKTVTLAGSVLFLIFAVFHAMDAFKEFQE